MLFSNINKKTISSSQSFFQIFLEGANVCMLESLISKHWFLHFAICLSSWFTTVIQYLEWNLLWFTLKRHIGVYIREMIFSVKPNFQPQHGNDNSSIFNSQQNVQIPFLFFFILISSNYEMRRECKLLFFMITLYLSFFVHLQLYITNYCFVKEKTQRNLVVRTANKVLNHDLAFYFILFLAM